MAHNSELTVKRIASLALLSDIDPASSCTVRAGMVGSMATQFARGAGSYVIGAGGLPAGRPGLPWAHRSSSTSVTTPVKRSAAYLVIDVLGGDIAKRSAGPTQARPSGGLTTDSLSCLWHPNW